MKLETGVISRRQHILATIQSAAILTMPLISRADSEDMTTQLFNEDGSLKDETIQKEAKFRKVELNWDSSSRWMVQDVQTSSSDDPKSPIRLSYDLPDKWESSYFDPERKAAACSCITVYRSDVSPLERATQTGVGKALAVPTNLQAINQADLVGGKTRMADGQKFYEFDMALAPTACGGSQENLGLGFCPYDSIYLLSSTVLDDSLFVMVIECDKDQWKRSNSDLRQVRSSFKAEQRA